MTKIFCDRCKDEVKGFDGYITFSKAKLMSIADPADRRPVAVFELCSFCYAQTQDFLNTQPPKLQ